jgi:hypothetical protein
MYQAEDARKVMSGSAKSSVSLFFGASFSFLARTEIGIRMTLGAGPHSMTSLMVGKGAMFALAGIGLGLVAALALTRLIANFPFGGNRSGSGHLRGCFATVGSGRAGRLLHSGAPGSQSLSHGGAAVRVDAHKCLSKICMHPRRTMPKR